MKCQNCGTNYWDEESACPMCGTSTAKNRKATPEHRKARGILRELEEKKILPIELDEDEDDEDCEDYDEDDEEDEEDEEDERAQHHRNQMFLRLLQLGFALIMLLLTLVSKGGCEPLQKVKQFLDSPVIFFEHRQNKTENTTHDAIWDEDDEDEPDENESEDDAWDFDFWDFDENDVLSIVRFL